ncbi:hypothetical protein RugamoR57_36610 [Duganella caerulea]|uniref:hypothetical protein n=1 Tax=Duganella caerulea TaxID=2885762 RepID=UPI0030E8BE43
MRNTICTNIRKAMSVSLKKVHSAAIEKSPSVTAPTEIQHLSISEYSAVAGGPQVENEPD